MNRLSLSFARFLPVASVLLAGAVPLVDAMAAPSSATPMAQIRWSDLASRGELRAGMIVHPSGGTPSEALRLENTTGRAQKFLVAVLVNPGVRQRAWSINGTIRYEAIEGEGYLEMWSVLPGGGEYFSRTLAPAGPLAALTGSSDWRAFALPFQAESDAQAAERLTFGVVLPGRGTVEIGPLELHQGENAMALAGLPVPRGSGGGRVPAQAPWWNDRTGGRVGAALGSLLGVLGGLVGVLASRGRARRLVVGLLAAAIVLGILLLGAGFIALGARQPYGVFYPLLLSGGLLGVLAPLLLRTVKQRYRDFELRRISALDAAR